MRIACCSLVCTALFVSPLLPAEESQTLQPEDEMKQVKVGSPAVSPNGDWIAYSVTRYCPNSEKNVGDIFLVSIDGTQRRQLTSDPGVESDYSWSPDGSTVVFSAKRGNDEKSQIYTIRIDGGEARRITDAEKGAANPLWSPDGGLIAFTSSVGELHTEEQREAFGDVRYVEHPRFYHLGPGWDDGARKRIFVIPADGGEARQLTDGECSDEGDHSMVWSPDSTEIAYVSNRSPEWWNTIDTNIYVVDVATGKSRQLTSNVGPDHSPAYSPDGKWIAHRASYEYNYESENYKIHLVPRAGGAPRVLTEDLDRTVRSIAWGPDSDRVYFTASSHGSRDLRWVDIDAPDQFHDVTSGEIISSFKVMDDDRFVLHAPTDVTPSEIWVVIGGEKKQLTTEASEWWKGRTVSPSEEIWVNSTDGAKIQGWLIRPVGYREGSRVPLILSIHGGPHGMYAPSFRFDYQLLANHGFAVLYANPRGSDGYGQAFANSIHSDWHTKPFADLMAFVDHVVEMGVADPKALGVTGGSYGGYMTNWVIGHTDRFAAAVSSAGLSNMVSFFGTTDEQFFAEKEMAGVPWRSREVYLSNSPLWAAESFTTPTMILHGFDDWRVRPEQGVQLFHALQKMGVPSVYVSFPGEQHGVRKTAHRVLRDRLALEWFAHWLKGEPVELATYIQPRAYVHPPTAMTSND
ncbi:MAG: S9 family peptidase [Acidobacteria bacterium]|nr:S9 family peptidase [Acidobacteriota bacterium]